MVAPCRVASCRSSSAISSKQHLFSNTSSVFLLLCLENWSAEILMATLGFEPKTPVFQLTDTIVIDRNSFPKKSKVEEHIFQQSCVTRTCSVCVNALLLYLSALPFLYWQWAVQWARKYGVVTPHIWECCKSDGYWPASQCDGLGSDPNQVMWYLWGRSCHWSKFLPNTSVFCKIWGFHGGDYEEWCLLGCYAVWLL
jgi:hypothetical protein